MLKQDVIDVTGSRQLCAGQKSECELIVHCVRELYDNDETEVSFVLMPLMCSIL